MRNKKMRRILTLLCALIFVGCTGYVIFQLYQYHLGRQIYNEAQALVDVPDFTQPMTPPAASSPVTQPEQSLPDASSGAASKPQTQEPEQAPAQSEPEPQQPDVVTQQPEPEPQQPEQPAPQEDPYVKALNAMDFSALQQVNKDVVGWITIPNTQLSYPLMQGENNEFYLERAWNKKWAAVGSIFLECQSSRDLSDFHTIVYGHRMRNGSMFGSLRNYSKTSYWKEHPSVYITDSSGTHVYDIYAAYEAALTDPAFWVGITKQEHKQRLIDHSLEKSVLDTGIVPTVDDHILTMSTCTGNGYATRWVVHAVKRTSMEGPA